ncbi:PorP/SprF family type IX secretion system membrane protein [Vaginella massiliensis]|uniref:PorP/SprF family type IX secretion system membrane protein n=1 Tax=Vaginella massiliensis TaxID=1816680 RepID=UPI0008386D94|nr:PorP/SprF family type IX secretion system membrane protein [Vaginella massiliensis]
MKKTLFLLSLTFGLLSITSIAQQTMPYYNHYLVSDKMLINPSHAGQNPEYISINASNRNQWDDLPNSPKTQTLSAHATVIDRLAVGTYFFNDRNGASKMSGFNLTAAYHIPIQDGRGYDQEQDVVSFGVGTSRFSQSFDLSDIIVNDPNDPLLNEDRFNSWMMNLGVSFKYANFFGGVSVLDIPIDNNFYYINNFEPLPTTYYLNLGFDWYLTEGIKLQPSLVYSTNANRYSGLDANLIAHLGFGDQEQGVDVGVSYKQGMSKDYKDPLFISPVVKVKIGAIRAGMSYDIGLSDFQVDGRKQGFLFSLGVDLANPLNPDWR